MKKLITAGLFAVFALFLPSKGSAAGGIVPMFTYQTAVSSISTNIVTVSTAAIGVAPGATQMDSPQMYSRVSVEIQNIDSSANLWCLPISTMPVVNAARKIAAGSSWIISATDTFFQVNYSTSAGQTTVVLPVKFWCVSDGASATKAAVTQSF